MCGFVGFTGMRAEREAILHRMADRIIHRGPDMEGYHLSGDTPENAVALGFRRLSIIAMNTAIEVDLAGNVNSTHIGEGAVMNGIGGSGDYARNSGIAIFSTASTAKDGAISCIVPHVAHVDHTEHDTEIIVTEQGLADLRGLTAYERAHVLIENCAHPKFRPGLREYVEQAYAQSKAKHGIIRL